MVLCFTLLHGPLKLCKNLLMLVHVRSHLNVRAFLAVRVFTGVPV